METGLYLSLPLAALALGREWRARRDLTYALPLLCLGPHMAYVARLGGDHFEYRPLDVYWPLLAVPAVVGIAHLGAGLAAAGRWLRMGTAWHSAARIRIYTLVLFLPVVFYCGSIQSTLRFSGPPFKTESFARLWIVPGIPLLVSLCHDLRKLLGQYWSSVTHGHARTARILLERWGPYSNVARGIIPDDALMFTAPAGIVPYFLPDLRFIDAWGLTDATIARTPVTSPQRRGGKIAHQRQPPSGYLTVRGVNFSVHPAVASREEALGRALYAAPVGPDLWMPFDAPSLDWVAARFEQFIFNAEAHRCCEAQLREARWPPRDRFDVFLDGNRLLYVKVRCAGDRRRFFLHVTPKDVADLPARSRQYGFDNLDFDLSWVMSVGAARCCAAIKELPSYPIASIRTGQFERLEENKYLHVWTKEFRFLEDN